ncbi:hypothetical protein KY330_04380 [Candidatus Woesearchaeota archaeon]|nr:hypothetical protein [Candidatus Woesearchaeota archaeon]
MTPRRIRKIKNLVDEGIPSKKQFVDKFAALITSAFGLVAALAWNEAVKGAFTDSSLQEYGPWVYAVIITIVAVLLTLWVAKIAARIAEQEAK